MRSVVNATRVPSGEIAIASIGPVLAGLPKLYPAHCVIRVSACERLRPSAMLATNTLAVVK